MMIWLVMSLFFFRLPISDDDPPMISILFWVETIRIEYSNRFCLVHGRFSLVHIKSGFNQQHSSDSLGLPIKNGDFSLVKSGIRTQGTHHARVPLRFARVRIHLPLTRPCAALRKKNLPGANGGLILACNQLLPCKLHFGNMLLQ
jgi:hypothetical protein